MGEKERNGTKRNRKEKDEEGQERREKKEEEEKKRPSLLEVKRKERRENSPTKGRLPVRTYEGHLERGMMLKRYMSRKFEY